jgi:hypothetical protein
MSLTTVKFILKAFYDKFNMIAQSVCLISHTLRFLTDELGDRTPHRTEKMTSASD